MKIIKVVMRLLLMYFILSISFLEINAQIDTNDVYPLQIGNIWEYASYTGKHYYKIVVDSVEKPNGKTYAEVLSINLAVESDTNHLFWRTDRDEVFIYDGGSDSGEIKVYDTSLPVGSAWIYGMFGTIGYGQMISIREQYYYPMFDAVLTYIFEDDIIIEMHDDRPPDTNYIDTYREFLKGVGIPAGYNGVTLIGAVINGKRYGNVTVGVEEQRVTVENYKLQLSAYPNPFNGLCNIQFENPKEQFASLKLYNLLGEEIQLIYKGLLSKGKHNIRLQMPGNLSSGIFFILLETGNDIYSKKIMYLK